MRFHYQHATIDRWLDGDTCAVSIDLGFHLTVRLIVRLDGVNAPEHGTPEGEAAWAHVQTLAPGGASVEVETVRGTDPHRDRVTYDRFVGRVFAELTPSGAGPGPLADVGLAMIAAGHAREWRPK